MMLTHEQWRDGIGYDLDALRSLDPEELARAEDLVVARKLADWRDVDALDAIASPRALAEVREALKRDALDVQIEAAKRLARRGLLTGGEIDAIIVAGLGHTTILNGLTQLLSFAEANPTLAVRTKLLWCALHGHDDVRVHAAALAHYLYGGSASSFDWQHRPLYLRFGSKKRSERRAAYEELCASVGVDPAMLDR